MDTPLAPTMRVDLYGRPVTVLDDEVSHYVFSSANEGRWKPELFRVFNRFLRPGMTFVDVGAFGGETALYPALLGCRVIAFEPDPVAWRTLCMNVALNPDAAARITLRNVAIATEDDLAGVTPFGARGALGSSVASMAWAARAEETARTTVRTMTLLRALGEIGVGHVDFLKVNVHGTEGELLQSLKTWLALVQPTVHVYVRPASCVDPLRNAELLADALSVYPRVCDEDNIELPNLCDEVLLARNDYKLLATAKGGNP